MSERRSSDSRIDPDRVARAKAADLAELAGQATRLRRQGARWVGLCPFHGERTPSFTVRPPGGGHPWRYRCYGCGAAGDAVDFVMQREGVGFREAVDRLVGGAETVPSRRAGARAPTRPLARPTSPARGGGDDEGANRLARARRLWRAAWPAEGTLVEAYLRARDIDLAAVGWPLPTLRFHPAVAYWHTPPDHAAPVKVAETPAMVALVQGPDGRGTGVHVTHLAPDGGGKARLVCPVTGAALSAKKMHGAVQGGAVRLAPPAESGWWAAAEGIETALSVLLAERLAGRDTAVWAALSLGNLAGAWLGRGPRHPSPKRRGQRLPSTEPDPARPGVLPPAWASYALVCADGDGKDPPTQRYLEALAVEKFRRAMGRAGVAKPPEGRDFNDLVRGDTAA